MELHSPGISIQTEFADPNSIAPEPMDIDHLQKLAGLDLTDREKRALRSDLRHLQNSIDRLESVDVEDAEPAFHPIELRSTERADESGQALSTDRILSNAPAPRDGHVIVPPTSTSETSGDEH